MKVLFIYFLLFLALILLGYYLLLPSPAFPLPPPDSIQSTEPGDSEELTLRRAYFTDYSREQVINHYKDQLDFLPTLRLNYPPEDSQTIIRDQTRSSYLEELAHPFRESFYINGFIPMDEKDDIWYKGTHFEQKVTVKYVQSNILARLLIISSAIFLLLIVLKEYKTEIESI